MSSLMMRLFIQSIPLLHDEYMWSMVHQSWYCSVEFFPLLLSEGRLSGDRQMDRVDEQVQIQGSENRPMNDVDNDDGTNDDNGDNNYNDDAVDDGDNYD